MTAADDDQQYEVSTPGDDDSFLVNSYTVQSGVLLARLDDSGPVVKCVGLALDLRGLGGSDSTKRLKMTMTKQQAIELGRLLSYYAFDNND